MTRTLLPSLLIIIICQAGVDALSSTISKLIAVNVTTSLQCTFDLTYSDTTVDLPESFVTCWPDEPAEIQDLDVFLTASNGFEFSGTININPTQILVMAIYKGFQPPDDASDSDASPEEMEFKEIYNNVSEKELPDERHQCGTETIMEEDETEQRRNRSYTNRDPKSIATDAVIRWSFISNGDGFAKHGVLTDANIGLPEEEVWAVMSAMKQIEAKTCIKFHRVKPLRNTPWLLISRDARFSDHTCMIDYIKSKNVGKNVENLGDVFLPAGTYRKKCISGAYANTRSGSPQHFVISRTRLNNNSQEDIGLAVHELLHNLGLGHTQQRTDALDNIVVNWGAIDESAHHNYKQCFKTDNENCGNDTCVKCEFYNDYDTPYDCMSIMHYRDTTFQTNEGWMYGKKTMTAKHKDCNLDSANRRLTTTDIKILNKMYCDDLPKKEVISTNHPNNYPDSEIMERVISVEAGKKIKLWFTVFMIEASPLCSFDWVVVNDGDGTILLDRACGMTKPKEIISRTNQIMVKFHSNGYENFVGFKAEYEAVDSAPIPVDGVWSPWTGWSQCENGKYEKSACKKKKVILFLITFDNELLACSLL